MVSIKNVSIRELLNQIKKKLQYHNLWHRVSPYVLKMTPRINVISFWEIGHVTSEVNFALLPLLVSVIEFLSNSTQTTCKYAMPIHSCSCLLSGWWSLIETLFHYLWPRVDTWELRVDLITFWQSCHATFKVNFGLWPLLVGLIKSNGNKNIIPTIFFSLSECIRFSNICVPHIWMKTFIQNACNVSFWCAAGWFCYIITQNMTCYSNAFLFWLWPTSQK